jgi:hypothetical protein
MARLHPTATTSAATDVHLKAVIIGRTSGRSSWYCSVVRSRSRAPPQPGQAIGMTAALSQASLASDPWESERLGRRHRSRPGQGEVLMDHAQTPHLTAAELAQLFGVAKSTVSAKASVIHHLVRISLLDSRWTLPSRMANNCLTWLVEIDGFIVDARTCRACCSR